MTLTYIVKKKLTKSSIRIICTNLLKGRKIDRIYVCQQQRNDSMKYIDIHFEEIESLSLG